VMVEERPPSGPAPPAVEWRRLDHGIGYVRIASFGDDTAVEAFDRALEALRTARAIVIDVRDNPGGDTAVARPIMGRLIDRRQQYAWMARRDGATLGRRWPEYVDPRGPWTYQGPVAVLVNHFSESMAEGFAMGLAGMKRATVVGTRMGGLGAGLARATLSRSGIGVQISAEPVYQIGGAPRDAFMPDVLVDPASARGVDPILDAALAHLGRRAARRGLRR
jgi:carboxyl-terminal processing protease